MDRDIADKINRARLLADKLRYYADTGITLSDNMLDLIEAIVDIQTNNVTRYELNLSQKPLPKPKTNSTSKRYRYASVLPIGKEINE